MSLLERSDQQKLKDWVAEDQIAKRFLTPSQYKKYKAGDQRRLGGALDIKKQLAKLGEFFFFFFFLLEQIDINTVNY